MFSRGRHILLHSRNRLSAPTARSLLCLGEWSRAGFVKDSDILKVVVSSPVDGPEEAFEDGWDSVKDVIIIDA